MQVVTPSRSVAAVALIMALTALAGCGTSHSSVAVGKASASATASAAAPISAAPSASVKPPTSTKPSSTASAAPTRVPTAVAPTPRADQTAAALLDSALSAMLTEKSVHVNCSFFSPNGNTTSTEDLGIASGRSVDEAVTFSDTELEVDGIGYFTTTSTQVLTVDGVPEADAEKLTGRWISMRPGDSYGNLYLNYTNVTQTLTLSYQANGLRLAGPLNRTAATQAQGAAVYGVSGGATPAYSIFSNDVKGSTETVYIAAGGAPLPVSVSAHSSGGTETTCNFSNWGEPLKLTAPANAVPVTSIPAN